jgi:hypothetical protein
LNSHFWETERNGKKRKGITQSCIFEHFFLSKALVQISGSKRQLKAERDFVRTKRKKIPPKNKKIKRDFFFQYTVSSSAARC